MVTRSTATVDDGFDRVIGRDEKRDSEPASGTEERKRTPETIAGHPTADPFDIDGGTDYPGSGEPRRRGRPKGSRNQTRTTSEKTQGNLGVVDLTSLLMSIHMMGASILDIEEIKLDPSEAEKYSELLKRVAAFYPMGLDPKKVAWADLLIFMGGGVYGPRIAAYNRRMKEERSKQPKPEAIPIDRTRPSQEKQATNRIDEKAKQQVQQITNPSQVWNEGGLNLDME